MGMNSVNESLLDTYVGSPKSIMSIRCLARKLSSSVFCTETPLAFQSMTVNSFNPFSGSVRRRLSLLRWTCLKTSLMSYGSPSATNYGGQTIESSNIRQLRLHLCRLHSVYPERFQTYLDDLHYGPILYAIPQWNNTRPSRDSQEHPCSPRLGRDRGFGNY
uniref:Uncharacterized protein n=1 Tax=Timema shepardi TaxID=629360 RepID=A0A7R9AXC8_TIMSH|nr:unnamed protein product [Timema shepardi]